MLRRLSDAGSAAVCEDLPGCLSLMVRCGSTSCRCTSSVLWLCREPAGMNVPSGSTRSCNPQQVGKHCRAVS